MLAFFADHCVASSIIRLLQSAGFQVTRLKDVMATNSPDPAVIQKASDLDLILLTLNGDFSDIVTYPPSLYRGIVSIQLHDRPEVIPALMKRLNDYLTANPDREHYVGKLFIVEQHRIRLRT